MNTSHGKQLDGHLRKALGPPVKPDFDSWRQQHEHAVAYLNPIVTALYQRRQRLVVQLVSGTVAVAILLAALSWTLIPEQSLFAQAAKAINEAQTITWRSTSYERFYSMDGTRTWLRTRLSRHAYKHPGLYRHTQYDYDGTVTSVEIIDSTSGEFLVLDMKAKTAGSPPSYQVSHDPDGPFVWVLDRLKSPSLEFVGQRNVNDRQVNVVRHHAKTRSFDAWIDPDSKQLVGYSDPGADQVDFLDMPDRDNPPERSFSRGTMLGGVDDEIAYNPKLDPDLFSLTPPEGFEIVEFSPLPAVTEVEMVEFLGVTARVNNDTFFDTAMGFDIQRFNEIHDKDKTDRTDAEQKLIDLYFRHRANDNRAPVLDFAKDNTLSDTFRYLGRGVKLGSADRIVCWYKLKSNGRYRGVFGDLTVRDVAPGELPLPVEQ